MHFYETWIANCPDVKTIIKENSATLAAEKCAQEYDIRVCDSRMSEPVDICVRELDSELNPIGYPIITIIVRKWIYYIGHNKSDIL